MDSQLFVERTVKHTCGEIWQRTRTGSLVSYMFFATFIIYYFCYYLLVFTIIILTCVEAVTFLGTAAIRVVAAAAGDRHAVVLTDAGLVYTWGSNEYG